MGGGGACGGTGRGSARGGAVAVAGGSLGEASASTSGAGCIGLGERRPTAREPITTAMLDDLPLQERSIETALHPRRHRRLARRSFDSNHMECGGSGTSTPRTTTPRAATRHRSAAKRPGETSCVPSSSSSLSESQMQYALHYGSEDDSDRSNGDEDMQVQGYLVPRTARLFLLPGEETDLPRSESPQRAGSPQPGPSNLNSGLDFPEAKATYGPSGKFNFEWRAFSQPQIQPELRREPFSNIECGPTTPYASPYEAFTAIWDHEIMENIAVETNAYAQQLTVEMMRDGSLMPTSRILHWVDTTVAELYLFFAIILAMGVVVKTRVEEYWETCTDIFQTPNFAPIMTINRFLLLGRCLHFNSTCDSELMSRAEAKIFKIIPIVRHLNRKFSQLYKLNQNIAIDDSLTQWKGWLHINQFIHNKAATVGIKTYEVCESQTGYLWRLEIHVGHDHYHQTDDPVSGIIPATVLRLLNGLEHKGHTIWMDKYYNSPALARELKVRGFDCVGTLRTDRQFVPVELKDLLKSDMAFGQVSGCTSGDVDLVVWKDKNPVALISTYHGLATVSCGTQWKPNIVADYNVCMGGVDQKDQMLAMYPIERRRTKVWYMKLFRRLLNVSVLNAYILYTPQVSISHRSFRKTLVRELLAKHSSVAPTPSAMPVSFNHFAAETRGDDGADTRGRLRRRCKVCKIRTRFICESCNVNLCIPICFKAYHTTEQ